MEGGYPEGRGAMIREGGLSAPGEIGNSICNIRRGMTLYSIYRHIHSYSTCLVIRDLVVKINSMNCRLIFNGPKIHPTAKSHVYLDQ